MNKHVIIIGGGVAGMSAAHELVERGFKVTVFERQEICGGKARSISIENTATSPSKLLPGEHGFRFFPGFYKHIIDTMQRIPFKGDFNEKCVADNLVDCPNMMMAKAHTIPIVLPSHLPLSIKGIKDLLKKIQGLETELSEEEKQLIASKLWQLLTTCKDRRFNEYERMGWWEFTEAATNSEAYRTVFVDGLTRTLVAAKAETCNTKTNGDILVQLMFNMVDPSRHTDRILSGPTNEKWLTPWLKYLKSKNVDFNFNSEAVDFEVKDRKIASVKIKNSDKVSSHEADYFICAAPVERAAPILNKSHLLALDPNLKFTDTLKNSVAWMNGIQFYLKEDVKIVDGHIILADSPWSLTAISQAQFWNVNLSDYGDGAVKGIISVDVSNWEKEGLLVKKPANKCTMCEVILEVWHQLKISFNTPNTILEDENFFMAFVDNSIIFNEELFNEEKRKSNSNMCRPALYGNNKIDINENEEPLLVNEINTWSIRNDSRTSIPNLFLASDYVRSFTDLATMEGANEAARRATNNIIDVSGSKAKYCKIWDIHEPKWLLFSKYLDKRRYKKGLAWKSQELWWIKLLNYIFYLFKK
ncbi:FAD-dependent oxidoreductase [Flavobacterium sp. DG2-3]|uniref:hydroxysqualene dehydroxylase n=1 Tax=Flavobacterium sp. DG2-3 TaxID=3068317 RepID=UPI00273E8674|nr:FAD-dependent oxidoreductase [Flavobacterium sp. DG2-3]MDP5199804.1 FAD-dependent oxidoreductase [Flavobacterium sp. DG2-3]